MTLKLIYDNKVYSIDDLHDGVMNITSSPFKFHYSSKFNSKIQISPFESISGSVDLQYKAHSKKTLSEIDGLLMHEIGKIKIEIIKGVIFLDDKSIEDLI